MREAWGTAECPAAEGSRIAAVVVIFLGLLLAPAGAFARVIPPGQQAVGQDCEKIKQEIQALQDDLANVATQMRTLQQSLDRINKDIGTLQQAVRFFSGPRFSETARGEALDQLAKAMKDRARIEQDIEDAANTIQALKEAIADLLNELGSCAPPNTTQPPKQQPPTEQPAPPSKRSTSSSQTSMRTTGAGIQFQLRGFGGASIVNGNTPGTAGFDGAVLFPLGNRVLVGPTAGFQWVDSSIVQTVGSQQPGSTFIHTSVGFKEGNFGGQIGLPFGGWQLGVQGGATVAGSTIEQAEGFCGTGSGGPTGGTSGCTTTSFTTTHDTVVGPFVGGYISHSIFSHVGVFVGYDYHLLKDTKSSTTVFDLHYSDVVAGFTFTFGRHK